MINHHRPHSLSVCLSVCHGLSRGVVYHFSENGRCPPCANKEIYDQKCAVGMHPTEMHSCLSCTEQPRRHTGSDRFHCNILMHPYKLHDKSSPTTYIVCLSVMVCPGGEGMVYLFSENGRSAPHTNRGIRSTMCGRYASYLNAFLIIMYCTTKEAYRNGRSNYICTVGWCCESENVTLVIPIVNLSVLGNSTTQLLIHS